MNIQIAGRDFRVTCAPDEREILHNAAEMLNREIADIQNAEATHTLSPDRVTTMAAFNFAAEILTLQADASNQDNADRIRQLTNKIEAVLND